MSTEDLSKEELAQRAGYALDVAARLGTIDGDHHKMWVIDQMVRHLTGCPLVRRKATDAYGKPYTYPVLGESEEYRQFLAEAGPHWEEGIAP